MLPYYTAYEIFTIVVSIVIYRGRLVVEVGRNKYIGRFNSEGYIVEVGKSIL